MIDTACPGMILCLRNNFFSGGASLAVWTESLECVGVLNIKSIAFGRHTQLNHPAREGSLQGSCFLYFELQPWNMHKYSTV